MTTGDIRGYSIQKPEFVGRSEAARACKYNMYTWVVLVAVHNHKFNASSIHMWNTYVALLLRLETDSAPYRD